MVYSDRHFRPTESGMAGFAPPEPGHHEDFAPPGLNHPRPLGSAFAGARLKTRGHS